MADTTQQYQVLVEAEEYETEWKDIGAYSCNAAYLFKDGAIGFAIYTRFGAVLELVIKDGKKLEY